MGSGYGQKIDERAFRAALGRYASGITIVAGLDNGVPAGFTCQAFQSVSADPPLVSVGVMKTSTSYPRIRKTGRFSVNVLSVHQQSLANQFARSETDKWAGVEWTSTANGNPVIAGTVMWLDCEIQTEYEVGDHFVVIGAVRELSPREWPDREPLLFYRGEYHRAIAS